MTTTTTTTTDKLPLVPLVRPSLGDAEVAETSRVIRSGWITQGPEVAAFEREFAAAVGSAHAAAVSNCTVAQELAFRALNIQPGDEVITVSHSFIATANSIVAVGAVPVFVDVCEDNWGMDPALIEAAITPKTKAIMCVHQVGIPCRVQEIVAIARKHGIAVVEDAACAIGSTLLVSGAQQAIGAPYGDIACFSFHPRKVVTTGDGGMITTNRADLDARVRLLRQHAMSISDVKRHSANEIVFEEYLEPAYNYRLTDLQAAVGRPQLRRLADIITERRRLADVYVKALAGHPILVAPTDPVHGRCNWQSYPTRMKPGQPLSQRAIMQHFLDAGIATKRGVSNAHQEPAYAKQPLRMPLPVSELLRDTTVLLPLFHGMTDQEQQRVIAAAHALVGVARAST
jgi:perosamine synthetase